MKTNKLFCKQLKESIAQIHKLVYSYKQTELSIFTIIIGRV